MGTGRQALAVAAALAVVILLAAAAVTLLGSAPNQAPAANASPNATEGPQANQTGPANGTAPPPPPPPPPGPQAQASDSSIGSLLDAGLARGDSRFEAEKGPYAYDINAYSWRYSPADSDAPDLMPVKQNDLNASYVRFPERYIDSLRGFAFKTYEPQQLAGPMKLFGVAVFLANSTALDGYGNKSFSITYDPHPLRSQTLEGCSILGSALLLSPTGNIIKVYDFRCKIIYGASP